MAGASRQLLDQGGMLAGSNGVLMRRFVTKACLLFLVGSTIGCDQVSKHFASTHLMGARPQSFLADTIRLQYAENRGAFLSLGSGLPAWVFTVPTVLIVAACVFAVLRTDWPKASLAGLALLIGGGLSNLLDRFGRGSVVDFLNIGIGSLRTGIFNVADMAIMCGIALLLVRDRES
jgi:signal peptidase II